MRSLDAPRWSPTRVILNKLDTTKNPIARGILGGTAGLVATVEVPGKFVVETAIAGAVIARRVIRDAVPV